MPQESIYYAIGRLSVMQKNTLDASKLERLLQAPTAQEARRTLSEMGWSAEGNYDRIAAQHVENACRLIREIATDEEEIDCFLLKYDVNNLKMLLKARSLGREAEDLSPCGVYPVEKLRKCVADRKYDGLPQTLKDKTEFLCNEGCWSGCMERRACYEAVSRKNLGAPGPEHRCTAPEAANGYRFSRAMEGPGFIGVQDIQTTYLPMGFSQFKIEGRGLGNALLLEFLLHYLTKPEYHLHVREALYLDNTLDLF